MKKQRLTQLDGIRAIAVILVVFYHLNIYSSLIPGYNLLIQNGGKIGVSIFFILSGYLMTTFYIPGKKEGIPTFTSFYKARFFRIVPLYIFSMILFFLLKDYVHLYQENQKYYTWTAFLKGLFLIDEDLFILNPVVWTLRIEMIFYLIFPLIGNMIYVAFKRKIYTSSLLIPISMILISCLVRFYNYGGEYSFFGNLDALAVGIMIVIFQKLFSKSISKLHLISHGYLLLLPIILLFILISKYSYGIFYTPSILCLLLGVVFYLTLSLSPDSVLNKLLSNYWFYTIALLSYSIYIWHFNLYYSVAQPIVNYFNISEYLKSSLSAALGVLLALLMSYLTYFYIEKPFLKWKDKF